MVCAKSIDRDDDAADDDDDDDGEGDINLSNVPSFSSMRECAGRLGGSVWSGYSICKMMFKGGDGVSMESEQLANSGSSTDEHVNVVGLKVRRSEQGRPL